MRRICLVLALAVLPAAAGAEPPDLEALLALYESYGLTHPPRTAPLVLYSHGGVGWGMFGRPLAGRAIGLQVSRTQGRVPGRVFVGTREWEPYWGPVEFTPVTLEDLRRTGPDAIAYDVSSDADLALALHLYARGDKEAAKEIWRRIEEDERLTGDAAVKEGFERPEPLDAEDEVRSLAWSHWYSSLTLPGQDRAVSLRYMTLLAKDVPALDNETIHSLLHSLKLTLVPSTAKPGTPEALIDALVEAGASPRRDVAEEAVEKLLEPLAELGLSAVPDLIRHFDDERLTRRWLPPEMNSDGCIRTVGGLVRILLRQLSGHKVESKDDAVAWWSAVEKKDEGEALFEAAFPPGTPGFWTNIPDELLFRALAKRCPKRLLDVYRALLESHPELSSWNLAKLVAECDLPLQQRVEALVEGSRTIEGEQHWYAACLALATISPVRCAECVGERLSAIEAAKDVKEKRQLCADVPYVCFELDRAGTWDDLAGTARKLEPDLRFNLLFPYLDGSEPEKEKHFLRFVRPFLEDTGVTDRAASGQPFEPGRGLWRMRVCDQVAASVARQCGLDIAAPGPKGTRDEWDKFVKSVRHELESLAR